MVAFANIDALVADQSGTTLTQPDADLLLVVLRHMLELDSSVGPILLGPVQIVDDEAAVAGEVRVSVARAGDDNPVMSVKLLAMGTVEVEVLADRGGVSKRLQRITMPAAFSYTVAAP